MKYTITFSSLFLAATLVAPAADAPAHIDVSKLPQQAQLVDEVVVPVPSEIFSVLDKLGSPNWHEVLRGGNMAPIGERPQQALLLGVVIAEGFIAVEAQESEEVKKIGRNVLTLSAAIGVKKAVVPRSNAIIEAADKKDWQKARQELDGALRVVKEAMIELHDDQLAQLVSLGGWLRGTEALTQVVQKNYSKDGAELLHQPLLLEYFQRRIDGLDGHLKSNPLVQKIQKQLLVIRPVIEGPVPTEKEIGVVLAVTQELVKSITSKQP